MSTPPPRLQNASPEMASMFAALRRDEPSSDLVAKILAIPEQAPLPSQPPPARGLPTLARWVVGGVCTLSLVGMGAAWSLHPQGAAPADPVVLAPTAHVSEAAPPAPPEPSSARDPSSEPTISVNDLPRANAPGAPPKAASARATAENSTFHEELALVESARAALSRNDAASSLRTLDTYEQRFHGGALAAEAEMTRIEALATAGRNDEARRQAERFLQQNGASPYGARVRAMLAKWRARGASPEPATSDQAKDTSR